MRFINENKFFSVLVLCVLIFGAAFYWFEWRPSKIIIKCNDSAHEFHLLMTSPDVSFRTEKEQMNLDEKFYRDCLRYEGLINR